MAPFMWGWPDGIPKNAPFGGTMYGPQTTVTGARVLLGTGKPPPDENGPGSLSFRFNSDLTYGTLQGHFDDVREDTVDLGTFLPFCPCCSCLRGLFTVELLESESPEPGSRWKRGIWWGPGNFTAFEFGSYTLTKVMKGNGEPNEPYYSHWIARSGGGDEKIVADLHIGPNGDPLTAYVAVTRVTGRDKLAILRPFDPKPYQQGTRLGRVLLLKVWRGEDIEWEALRSTFLEEKRCAECGVLKRKNEHTAGQWKRADEKRICKECVARRVEDGAPWQCSVCSCFPTKHQRAQCKEQKKCDLCERDLEENQFSKSQWTRTRLQRRRRKVAEAKVAKVLREVRAEIQEANAKKRRLSNQPPTAAERPATAEEPEEERQHRHAQALGRKQGSAKERKEYECPYCHAKTHSSIRTGKVQVAGHCGKQFRVRHGDV
eukprot:symbB.v1.2.011989.t1/scaffold818.1/size162012/8